MIEIGHRIYNHLARELIKHREREGRLGFGFRYPFLYLVCSQSSDSVINKIYKVRENTDKREYVDKCYRMSNISAREFSRKAIKIMRKGHIIRGLVRVGEFVRPSWGHEDGSVEYELNRINTAILFITVQPSGINMRSNYTNRNFKIIREK